MAAGSNAEGAYRRENGHQARRLEARRESPLEMLVIHR